MLASGDGTVDLNIDNGTFVVDVSTSRVGIGAAPTDGTLHVQTASAGTVAASTQADDIVIENNAEGGMTIITPDDQSARIRFTSPSTNNAVGGATIFYRQNINKMLVGTAVSGGVLALASGAGNETMLLSGAGNVGIGTALSPQKFNVLGTHENAGFYRDYSGSGLAATYLHIGRKDTNGALVSGARISGGGDDGVEASHNGYFEIATRKAGVFVSLLSSYSGASDLVVNEAGIDIDFRVESGANTHALFVQGSDGHVGIGTSSPDSNNFGAGHGVLAVASATGSAKTAMVNIVGDGNDTANTRVSSLFFNDASATGAGATLAGIETYRDTNHATDPGGNLRFSTNQSGGSYTERMRIESDGTVVSSKASGIFFKNSSGGTNSTQIQISNGGGDMRVGVESSSGGALQTGTSAYAAVFGNQSNYPTQFTTNGTTKMTINADGIVVHNGVSTYSNSVSMMNNVAYVFDIPVGNEGGAGNVIEVHAMYDHYYNFAYGASLITLVGKRGVSVSRSDIKVITTTNGGTWNVSAPNATTLRLTKTAGSYPGPAFGHIMVRFRKS